jgi:hypothetical protein
MARTVIRGSSNLVGAVTPQLGLTFAGWSDGGALTHNVTVAADTRLVARFAGPPGAAAGAAPAPALSVAASRAKAHLVHRRRPLTARRDGSLSLRAHCPSPTPCAGTVAIRALTGGATLGRARFTVPAGRTITVRVRLTSAARSLLTRRGHLRAVSILELAPSRGTHRRTDTVFTLRAPART